MFENITNDLIAFWLRERYSFSRDIQNWNSNSFLYLGSKVVSQHVSSRLTYYGDETFKTKITSVKPVVSGTINLFLNLSMVAVSS